MNPVAIESLERVGGVCGFGTACRLFAGLRLGAIEEDVIDAAPKDKALTS